VVPLRKQLKDEAKAKKAVGLSRAGGKKKVGEKDARLREYELTVGIEIHAQLNTARKLFSCTKVFLGVPQPLCY
jgi:aspartyl-tRNA(Asn)/glutamyl-tRNA(Gln) amidotransferase subunit B